MPTLIGVLEGLFFILASVAIVAAIVVTVTMSRHLWHRRRGTLVSGAPTGRSRHTLFPWSPPDEIEVVVSPYNDERVTGWIWDNNGALLHADSIELAVSTSKAPSREPQLHLIAAPSRKVARAAGIVMVAVGSASVLACWASVCG